MLDIIMPHYKEPWETVKKFFAMLDLQRDVNFNDFRVIFVNDGPENALPEEHFKNRPYQVDILSIPHGGVSAARNAGLKAATAEWVMFCDCDDMFANVFALRDYMTILPAPGFDMLWADFISENVLKDGTCQLHKRGQNVVFMHGKVYRREFLLENNLFFDERLSFNEDSAFNAIANTYMDYKRTGKIETMSPPYLWCYSPGSATTTPGNRSKALMGAYERNKLVCEAFKERMPYPRYCAMVARTVWDTYYSLNVDPLPAEFDAMLKDFRAWFAEHKQQFLDVEIEQMIEVEAISRAEHKRGDEEEEARWAAGNVAKLNENITLKMWLDMVEKG